MDPKKQEFIALFEASGWTQAEAARRLEMTRGGFNGIITGITVPSPSSVKLLRLLLEEERGPMVFTEGKVEADWLREIMGIFSELRDADRIRIIKAVKAMAEGLPRREPISYRRSKPVSSKPLSDAQALALRAGEAKGEKH